MRSLSLHGNARRTPAGKLRALLDRADETRRPTSTASAGR